MDKKLARRNIRSGLLLGMVVVLMFGLSFLAAALYVS